MRQNKNNQKERRFRITGLFGIGIFNQIIKK
jgi:hypothetical protein